jgi:hypothetical protein
MSARQLTALSAAAFVMSLILTPIALADSNCTTAAACAASFDDGNPGDNQGGDAGADRERPSDQRK